MDLDAGRVVQHLQVLKHRLPDLLQVLRSRQSHTQTDGFVTGLWFRVKPAADARAAPTCLEFWFSILVLTSGCSVKSGAKYSKYSVDTEEGKKKVSGHFLNC